MGADAKIEEKFTDLEARIGAVEKSGANEKTCREESTKANPWTVPIEYKAVVHGFKEDSKEEEVKAVVEQINQSDGNERCGIHNPAIPITHVIVEFQNTKIRDRYVRSASM